MTLSHAEGQTWPNFHINFVKLDRIQIIQWKSHILPKKVENPTQAVGVISWDILLNPTESSKTSKFPRDFTPQGGVFKSHISQFPPWVEL